MRFTPFFCRGSIPARFSLLCLVLLPVFAQAAPKPAPARMTDAQIVQDLGSYLDRLAAKDAFSGAVLLAKGDQILFEHAYGYANHAFSAPNKVDTKFNLGSMGKMFTAVAILQLAQQGKLSLTDTVLKLLPDYPDKEIANKISVHQLLTHTSGLGNFFNQKFNDSSRARYRTTQSHLPLIAGESLLFAPGTKWTYSNSGFIVLGLIIERVSGESYYDYVREHIFKPAGMLNTDNYNVDDDVPNLALGYTNMGDDMRPHTDKPRRTNILMHVGRGGSAGGGYSTVEDLLRFAQALQEHKLLNQEYTNLDMTGKVQTPLPGEKYAYGMIEAIINGVRIVGHGGAFPGINSNLDMFPTLGYTVAVMSNYDDASRPVDERLRSELTGQELPQAIHLPLEAFKAVAGKYAPAPSPDAPPGMRMPPIEITADQDGLRVNIGMGGRSHRFLPLSPEEFFDEDSPNARLSFAKDEKGQVGSVTMKIGPAPMKAIRLP